MNIHWHDWWIYEHDAINKTFHKIEDAGLVVGSTKEEYSSTVEAGKVIGTGGILTQGILRLSAMSTAPNAFGWYTIISAPLAAL